MKRIDLAIMLGVFFAVIATSFAGFAEDCDTVRQEVVRLHILAPSDSEEDQQMKLAVRDAILSEAHELFSATQTKETAEEQVLQNKEKIREVALQEMRTRGYEGDAEVKLVNMYFETREYEDYTMPAGYYDAVRVILGEGKGKNWWCVMFPPMCIPAATPQSEHSPAPQLAEFGARPTYKAKFAVVELLESLREKRPEKEIGLGDIPAA